MLCCFSCCCPAWCAAHGSLQDCTVILLYVQCLGMLKFHYSVVCAMVGSLGALYTGLVLANLALALFALVAIESNNQTLGRVYGSLLAFALLLDIVWFILFTFEIRQFSKGSQVGKFGMFSIKLLFLMQATGCALRFVSSCLWIQIYRIGAATDTSSRYQPVEFSRRITNLSALSHTSSPITINAQSTSMSDRLLGTNYNTATLNSLRQSSSDEDNAESSEFVLFWVTAVVGSLLANTAPPSDNNFNYRANLYHTNPTPSPDIEHDQEIEPYPDSESKLVLGLLGFS